VLSVLLCLPILAGSCASLRTLPKHRDLQPMWSDYQKLPDSRALVVAGELRRNQWVAGASGGHSSVEDAIDEAMKECLARRSQRRIQAPCLVYAQGEEVVWPHR